MNSNLTFNISVGTGTQTVYPITASGENMGYFRTSDITGYVDGVEVQTTINPSTPHMIIFTIAPKLGSTVMVRREMPIGKPYANFERGNNFGHRQVNNTFLQQLYLTQELLDGFLPNGFYWKQDIDMGGFNISNVNKVITREIETDVASIGSLSSDLDMRDYRLLNLPTPIGDKEPIRKGDLSKVSGVAPSFLYVDSKIRTDSASQLDGVYKKDWQSGDIIPNGAVVAKLMYWHNGQFYSVGTDIGFKSNDFAADLVAGRFVSEGLVTVSSIGIFIADNTGTSDVSDALSLSNTKNNVTIQRGTYRIAKDTHINANTKYKIERGAMIVVDDGVTLTWDAEIDAGWYQIFGLTGSIKPTNRVHNTPIENRYIGSVKTTWFGVINDGVFPTNYKDPSIPSPVDGQMPTGTDSTLAFKRAFAFCQYASYKNGHYVVQFERVTLEFEHGSQVILKGRNLFNEQIYLTELDALESEANVDGGDFLAMPEYQEVGVFNVTIDGGNSTIMWHPESENDVFANVRQLISNFEIKVGLSLVPVGVTAAQFINGYGYFLTNNALVQKGGTSGEYFNSLSYQQFTRLNVMLPSIGLPQSAVSTEGAFKWLFGYLGYSLGDRLHLKDCKFNGFDKVVYCQNPESVEFNATGCSFRSKRNNATFFHYLSFYGQFRIEGCGIFMKGENQTFIHADDSAGVSKFIDTAEFTAINNRMETGNNNKVTLIKGEYGRFILSQLNPNYGSNGITTDSIGVHLEKGASAILENVNVPTTSELYQITPQNKFPLWFKHCNFYARDNIDSITYSDDGVVYKNYKFAIAQGGNVPAVIFENCPVYTQSDNIIDAPRIYGGKGILAADIESAELKQRDGQGYERINGKSFIMPRYCVVTQMRLQIKAMHGASVDSVKVSFGSLVKTHELTGGVANDIELLTTPISMPDTDESGRTILIEYQKGGVTVADGSPSIATIRYRCSQGRTELTGDNAYEPWL